MVLPSKAEIANSRMQKHPFITFIPFIFVVPYHKTLSSFLYCGSSSTHDDDGSSILYPRDLSIVSLTRFFISNLSEW